MTSRWWLLIAIAGCHHSESPPALSSAPAGAAAAFSCYTFEDMSNVKQSICMTAADCESQRARRAGEQGGVDAACTLAEKVWCFTMSGQGVDSQMCSSDAASCDLRRSPIAAAPNSATVTACAATTVPAP